MFCGNTYLAAYKLAENYKTIVFDNTVLLVSQFAQIIRLITKMSSPRGLRLLKTIQTYVKTKPNKFDSSMLFSKVIFTCKIIDVKIKQVGESVK